MRLVGRAIRPRSAYGALLSSKNPGQNRCLVGSRSTWTWRNCAGFFSLLFYASVTLGIFRTEFFGALRFIRDAAGRLAHRPEEGTAPRARYSRTCCSSSTIGGNAFPQTNPASSPRTTKPLSGSSSLTHQSTVGRCGLACALGTPYTFTHTIGHQNSPGPNIRRRLSPGRSTISSAKP
jgi:hypothetical protein